MFLSKNNQNSISKCSFAVFFLWFFRHFKQRDLCGQLCAFSTGFKDHTTFHKFCEKHLLIHTKTGNMYIPCKAFMCQHKSRFCDLCEQVLTISPGFKDHTEFHKFSFHCCVDAKVPCVILNHYCFTEKFTHVYSKNVSKVCFAIGPGFKDHKVFHGFCVDESFPCVIFNQSGFAEKIQHYTPKTFVICVSKFFKDHTAFHEISVILNRYCSTKNPTFLLQKRLWFV